VLTLSGANTYTGATDVDGGTLVVNGSLLSTVNVNSGGTFKGSGTIRGLNVGSGGIVAPGNSIGTLTIAGDASFATGSVYQAEVNASGQSDRISLSGKTTISGGTVQAVAASGAYGLKTTYTILNSFGGVSGTFSNATTNLAFLTATLSYNASDVFLTLSRNRAFLPGLAKTPNQTNVANALNAVPTDNAAFVAAFGAGTPQAFDALSGEVHADIQTTLIDDSRYVREAVLGRLRQASYAGAGGPLAVLGAGGPTIAYADESDDPRASTVLAYASGNPAFPVKAVPIKAVAPAPARYTYWAQAFGAWGKFGGDGNAADTARSLGGVISGFDARFANNWQAGFALGYTQSDVNVAARSSSGLIDSAHAAVYAGTSVGAWNLRSGAALAWNVVDTSRTAAFPGFTDLDTAKYNSGTGQLFAEIGYGTTVGSIAVEPFADIAYVYLGTQGFEEAGGAAALSAASAAMGVTYSSLGMRLATEYTLMNGWMLTPRLTAAWQHAFGSISPTDALTFANTTANFTVAGVPLARDGALIEVGGELRLTPHIRLGATYSGQLADGVHDHAIKGNFTWTF
jgi:outer membrane autotransporter protein